MPPPASTLAQKRLSLPAQISHDEAAPPITTVTGGKRKRDETDAVPEMEPRSSIKRGHKRSSTIEGSTMSAPPHRTSRAFRTSINSKRVGDGSLLGDTLMRQARRLAEKAKSDTTRTDYFKLKAMGIDPDTPLVPETKKRPRATTTADGSTSSVSQQSQASSRRASATPVLKARKEDDDEEALFASIRSVREAMAESTSWYQSERQSIERSMTPQTNPQISVSPKNLESPAEARLRELKEKGRTPTRTEIRQRNAKDKSFLPVGFWDSPRTESSAHGKGKEKEAGSPGASQPPPRMMGFAALAEPAQVNGWMNGNHHEYEQEEAPLQAKGGSVDDAIEL